MWSKGVSGCCSKRMEGEEKDNYSPICFIGKLDKRGGAWQLCHYGQAACGLQATFNGNSLPWTSMFNTSVPKSHNARCHNRGTWNIKIQTSCLHWYCTFPPFNDSLNHSFHKVLMNKLYQKFCQISPCLGGNRKTRLSPSHQSLWHFALPLDQLKGCSFYSAKDLNSFQVSMRQGNKSANPAFIPCSRFVSLLLDLRHPDWGPQRNSSWQLY